LLKIQADQSKKRMHRSRHRRKIKDFLKNKKRKEKKRKQAENLKLRPAERHEE
jgi:hypothetical protein